jgi:hypothetical protein
MWTSLATGCLKQAMMENPLAQLADPIKVPHDRIAASIKLPAL